MNPGTMAAYRAIYAQALEQLRELDRQLIYGEIDNNQYTADCVAVESAAQAAIEAAREPQREQQ